MRRIVLFLLLFAPAAAGAQDDGLRVDSSGEYLILEDTRNRAPWKDGCNEPGRTCRGWSADGGCLGHGGNPGDNVITYRARPKRAGGNVELRYTWDDNGTVRKMVLQVLAPTRRGPGCGVDACLTDDCWDE